MPIFNFSTGGALDGMKTMLKNNELIKNKIHHFSDKKKGKYKNKKLKIGESNPEDIIKIREKIKKQERRLFIKKIIILGIFLALTFFLLLLILNKL